MSFSSPPVYTNILLSTLIQINLIALKLIGYITSPWWLVLLPLIAGVITGAILLLVYMLMLYGIIK